VAIASFADSFKEAQIYIMPLFLVVVLPAVVSALPGTQLNGFWMVVPVTNLCLLMKELFLQQATVEQITVVFVCSCAYAGAALSLAVRLFSDEEVLFPSDQSFALFRGLGRIRRGGMSSPLSPKLGVSDAILAYALVFPLAYYSGTLVASWSPLGSLLLSQWGIILGVPLLLTLWGRLDYRRTFRLLMPKPQAFAGVLLTLVGSLVLIRFYGAWQERWLPSPPSIEENLLRILKDASGGYLLPLLFLGALTPAVCEECLCRGFILGGLRTRFSKWQSIFLSAVLFGALHMLIYQFIPTTLLGLLLAWFALETGSILPSILFHFLNNGITFAALHFSQYGESPPTGGESAKWGLAWLTQFSVPEMVRGPALIVVLAGAAGMLLAGCWIVRRAGRSNPENR
jgi:membrane protease YdiL (CAAX protease family)